MKCSGEEEEEEEEGNVGFILGGIHVHQFGRKKTLDYPNACIAWCLKFMVFTSQN